jgi:Tol biopolymer transport system component
MNFKDIYKKLYLKNLLFLGLAFVLITPVLPLSGCAAAKKYDRISNISFSPDSKKLLFDCYRDDRQALIHMYNLETGELSAYSPPQGEGWYQARYSFDGKHIAFTIIPESVESNKLKQDLANTQIALMDPDGKNVKKITDSPGWKIYPSFSHDNKKVIFAKAGKLGQRVPAIFYDVYEVDLDWSVEIRLTRFRFDVMSAPFYFPDDERIIFSVFGLPNMYPGIAENDYETIRKKKSELEAKFRSMTGSPVISDNVYVCNKGQEELPEPFIKPTRGYAYRNPQITVNGLLFYDDTGQVIMQYSSDGNHRRLNKPIGIRSYAVSPDGMLLALVLKMAGSEIEKYKIVIYRVSDSTISKEITLPDAPAPIINRQ